MTGNSLDRNHRNKKYNLSISPMQICQIVNRIQHQPMFLGTSHHFWCTFHFWCSPPPPTTRKVNYTSLYIEVNVCLINSYLSMYK